MTSITYSCLSWVPRGAAREQPDLYEAVGGEFAGLKKKLLGDDADMPIDPATVVAGEGDSEGDGDDDAVAGMADDVNGDSKEAKSNAKLAAAAKAAAAANSTADPEIEKLMRELQMDKYDADGVDTVDLFAVSAGGNASQHATFVDNTEDPYLTVKDADDPDADDDTHNVAPTDSLICVGHSEKEEHNLRVYLYSEKESALFIHADYPLPQFPLCTQFIDCGPSVQGDEKGAYCAVGLYNTTGIELWNLDLLNNVSPEATLDFDSTGAAAGAGAAGAAAGAAAAAVPMGDSAPAAAAAAAEKSKARQKKDKKKAKAAAAQQQKNAVMCLAWNPARREVLAAGYADGKIRLWNVRTKALLATLSHHTAQVQALEWHPTELNLLLSGGYDKSVCIVDVRAADKPARYPVDANVETARWDAVRGTQFWVSTESGTLTCHDARKPGERLFALKAHDKATTAIALNRRVPLLATASIDGMVKLWDMSDALKPKLLFAKPMKVGALFCMNFDVSAPYILACGGEQDVLAVWDITENPAVDRWVRAMEYTRAVAEAKATGKPMPQPPQQQAAAAAPAGAAAAAAAPAAAAAGAGATAAAVDADGDAKAPKKKAKAPQPKLKAQTRPSKPKRR